MNQDLAAFFAAHTPSVEQVIAWGEIRLEVKSYLCTELPPSAFVTSVRSVLLRHDQILVVRDPESHHVLPGGRVEAGENLTDTLRRELLEETGWTIDAIRYLGVKHFRHLTPKPQPYPYPYPDFLQAIYVAQAVEYRPEALQSDEYVVEVTFYEREQIDALGIDDDNHLYLNAALQHFKGNA